MAAADACNPRATLTVTSETEGDAKLVVVCAPAESAPKDDGVNLALARKLAENGFESLTVPDSYYKELASDFELSGDEIQEQAIMEMIAQHHDD